MRQNSHYNLNINYYSRFNKVIIKIALFFLAIFKYKIFHFYFGESLLPFNLDLPLLKLFNKKTIMTYCGSEVRLIKVEKCRNPYSHFLKTGLDNIKFDNKKKIKMRWHGFWIDRVTAIRGLYDSVSKQITPSKIIKDIWLNNIMNLDCYKPINFRIREKPLLIHAPSEKGIKGTKYVEKAIEGLKKRDLKFEYRRIEKTPNHEAQKIYQKEADIIIDQFLLGGFGSLAVEGMYYGKPVCCYLIEEVKKEHFPDCPIVNANIDNLEEKLAWLIENPDERIRLGKEGREYVERHFDSKKINQQIWNLYKSL